MENKYKNTGGLWKSKTKSDEEYFFGSFDVDGKVVKIKVFPNTFKKPGDRTPDYRILLDDGAIPAPKTSIDEPRPKSKKPVANNDGDDIPF